MVNQDLPVIDPCIAWPGHKNTYVSGWTCFDLYRSV